MHKNLRLVSILLIVFSMIIGNTCESAEDYGLVNSGAILSGNFSADGDDYWISFTTSCEFQNITLSTCGSYAENTDDGIEYLDTILEVYVDSDNGDACDLFEPWAIDTGSPVGTDWWNDDPEDNSEYICTSQEEDVVGEDNHAVLVIPSLDEQLNGTSLFPSTYYVRISGYPGHSVGEWNLHLEGSATISLQIDDQYLSLPHDPDDGAPGGFMNVNLDASESVCSEQITSYFWYDESTEYGTFSNPVEIVSMEYGTHNLSLIATDFQGNEYEDDVVIEISEPNVGPFTHAGEDLEVTVPHDGDMNTSDVTIILSGELSSDPENDDLFYDWISIESPDNIYLNNSDTSTPSFVATNSFGSSIKEYEFQLTTSDVYGEVDIDSVRVSVVSEQNTDPVASAPDLEITILHDGNPETFQSESFVLNASDSYDPDSLDNLVYYQWQTIANGQLETISYSFLHTVDSIYYSTIDSVLGEHQYKLIVKDPYDAVDDTTFIVNVLPEPNEAPVVQFDPYQVVYFSCIPNEDVDCSQLVSLNSYNATYDPEGDEFSSNWYTEDWSPTSSLQTLDQGTSTFNLVATDSYYASDTLAFSIVIAAPNSVPVAITLGTQEVYESTAELDMLDGLDSRFLFGSAVDEDHIDSDLGVLWSLTDNNDQISILDSTSLTGEILSGDISNNDYPLNLPFLLEVWDPFSCHPSNPYMFNDINENGVWDDGEIWDPICPIGDDPMTYGNTSLDVFIQNYNSAPDIDPESSGELQNQLNEDQWMIYEDVDTLISFNFNSWASAGLFSDPDDCLFDLSTGCSLFDPYPADSFRVTINNGENYHTGYICDSTDTYYSTLLECDSICGACISDQDMLVLKKNFSDELITVEFQIDDRNEINNLSDTLYIDMFVVPVNDIPEILSFENQDLDTIGVIEDSSFPLTIDDITFYDVEGDVNENEICDSGECENIFLYPASSPDYNFSNDSIFLTENFFGNLDLGIQLVDFGDTSEVYIVSIPVEGTNDDPNLIQGMDTLDYLQEDFDSLYIDLGTIFEDVDGEELFYVSTDSPGNSLILSSEVMNDELLLVSEQDLFGTHTLDFQVSDQAMIDAGTYLSESITFIVSPVNDSPIAISNFIETPEDSSVYITMQGEDIDSDSLIFEIISFPSHGTLGDLQQLGPFSSDILYTPESGYRCGDSFEFIVKDLSSNGDVLLESNPAEIEVNVGDCNFPPDVAVGLDINVFEDNTIYFINSNLPNSELADNHYSLNNESNFFISDDDSISIPFIEFWEGNHYYIENGYCASPTASNNWEVDTTKTCGLIPYYAICDVEFLEEDTNYNDGSKYCACSPGETCTASGNYLDTLAIRPRQDFDSYFDITTIANDGDISYNLSDSSYTRVYISPINDAPEIGVINNQVTDEGQPLSLNYIYSSEENEGENSLVDFFIYDVDNESSEISFNLNLNDIYFQTEEQDSLLVINLINPDYNVSSTEIMVVLKDEEFLTDTAYFDLTVNQIDDPNEFQSIGVNGNQGQALTLLEDTGALDFTTDITIYYTDVDYDPLLNDQPELSDYADSIFWNVSSINGEDSNIQFYTNEEYPSIFSVAENDQLYYSQPIILEYVSTNWNGYDGLYFINDDTADTLLLSVHITEQNDMPEPFDVDPNPVANYNRNAYSWTLDEVDLCLDENLEQGVFDYETDTCLISNFYKVFSYTCDATLDSYQTQELCQQSCIEGSCEQSYDDMYYRLPYRRVPGTDSVQPDSLLLNWETTYDIDLDPDFSQDPNNDLHLFYRVELVDNFTQRAFVISESILESHAAVLLDKSYFTYNVELNYYDSCGVFSKELSLSDTSHQYLDLTGNTEYSWRIAANNCWCDELGSDPSYITTGENAKTDFYIDIIPPKGSINILQDEISPEFMNIYITFDEQIDEWKSEVFITYEQETTSHNLPQNTDENIYGITELFPGIGVTTIDVESWDGVGNGTISTISLTYEEVQSAVGKNIYSPSQTLMMSFDEGDIDYDASIIIKETDFINNQIKDQALHRVSQIYEVSSVNMDIINPVDLAVEIPDDLYHLEYWKFKLFSVSENGQLLEDITSVSKKGLVVGQTNNLSYFALYYDTDADFEIPSGVDLVGSYPNPFNPSTNIFYYVEGDYDPVSIRVLDLLGREVKILYDDYNVAGYYEIRWDGTNMNGEQIGSGIYFIDARVGSRHTYKKVMKLK